MRTYCLEEHVKRITRLLFSGWPSLISEYNDFICSESLCCLVSAQEGIMVLKKKLFEDFQHGCLVHGHL